METVVIGGEPKMKFDYFFLFLGISILSSASCRNSALGMVRKIGVSSSSYPRGYIHCSKRVKRIFKIKSNKIPRYLYFELLVSIVFAFLCPINFLISLINDYNSNVVGLLVIVHASLIILNFMYFAFMTFIYKKK